MIPTTLAGIAEAVGGTLHGADGAEAVTGPVDVDTRRMSPGGLFVALAGERADGHDYAGAAVEAGAVGVLGTRPTEVPTVVVEDAVEALGALAHHVVGRVPGLTVVGLTGSQGKTSTKDLLAALLGSVGDTVATAGNFNNELGMPITALRVTPRTRFLVLEMGARGPGHIAWLCRQVRPDIALVLNVGKAHLSEFGTQQAIAEAKGELVAALPPAGRAVLNADDPLVLGMADRTEAPVTTYGAAASADLRVDSLTTDELGRPHFELHTRGAAAAVAMRLLGEHHAANAAAAAAVGLAVGMDLPAVASGLSRARSGSPWRMELHQLCNGVTLVNDAYNANPDSMRAALETLAGIGRARPDGRTVAVLGEMLELGAAADEEHAAVGRLVARLGIDQLVVVGDGARHLLGRRQEQSGEAGPVWVPDADGATRWLREHAAAGDVVLVKASRGAALELVADALVAEVGEQARSEETTDGQKESGR